MPIFISLIGFGTQMRVTSIALAALFPTMIATVDGIRSVSNDLLDVSRVYRLTRKERVLKVLLPAAPRRSSPGCK